MLCYAYAPVRDEPNWLTDWRNTKGDWIPPMHLDGFENIKVYTVGIVVGSTYLRNIYIRSFIFNKSSDFCSESTAQHR